MLTKIALVYCVIEFVRMGFRIVSAIEIEAFSQVQPWIFWSVNILGIVAILSYGLRRTFFPRIIWLVILVSYIGIRVYELVPYGLVPTDTALSGILLVGLHYAYLVVPSVLCLSCLSFSRHAYKAS